MNTVLSFMAIALLTVVVVVLIVIGVIVLSDMDR